MRINRCGVLGVLLLSQSAFAQAPAQVSMADFDQNLAAYARSIVSVVSPGHLIHVFHWETREASLNGQSQNLPILPRDPRVINHMRFLQGTFQRARGFGVAGPGLYAATDPESSAEFGDLRFTDTPDWVLVELVIPPGVRFFDGTKDKGISTFSPTLAAQVQQFGCSGGNAQSIFTEAAEDDFTPAPGQPVPPPNPNQVACLQLRSKLVAATGASAMKYPFGSSQLQGCGPKSKFAFMLYGDDAIGFNTLTIYSADLPQKIDDGHQIDRLRIEGLFAKAGHPIDPWPVLAGLTPEPALDLLRWMKDHIVNCVPGRFPEDANPPETPAP